jgi:CheY-like chemotaxis protein
MQNKTLFLIDDDFDDQDTFLASLRKIDPTIECVTAKDGLEALEYIHKNESFIPDFIFLDLNMPVMNGTAFLARLSTIEKFRKVPLYIYTTSTSVKDKEETMSQGAVGFIIKPNSISKLKEVLSELLLKSFITKY